MSWRNVVLAITTSFICLAFYKLAILCLNVRRLIFSAVHKMIEIDLRSFEPLVSIDDPPDGNQDL